MKLNIIKVDFNNQRAITDAVKKAAEVIGKRGIVIHPTDTCYGIATDIKNEEAVKKAYKFKGRNYNKPFSIIVSSFIEFKKYGQWFSLVEETIRKNPQKMFTFVVPRKKTVPFYLNPDFSTIGIQVPKYKFSLSLLKKIGSPSIATSANVSGMANVYSIEELLIQLKKTKNYPDLILDGGKLPFRKPSSVIEIKDKSVKVLR